MPPTLLRRAALGREFTLSRTVTSPSLVPKSPACWTFSVAKFLEPMEGLISSASRPLDEGTQPIPSVLNRGISRCQPLTLFIVPRRPVFSRLNIMRRRNELVQDRDVGDMWYAFIPPRGRTCRY